MPIVVRFESSYIEPYPLQVQGESYYRKNLEDVSNYMGEAEGVNADDFIAQLILDDANEFDPGNAVRIEIDGKIVGHLTTPAAKKYRKRLAELGLSDMIGECYASIKGGFIKRSTGEQADFGVRLDLDIETFKQYVPHPVQPTPAPEPIQAAATAPAIEVKPAIKNSQRIEAQPFPRNIFDWFFNAGKYRIWRILLLLVIILMTCFSCTIFFGLYLQATGQG